ncbi:uncharacterized protein N7506_007459 [Penicillium brevicompactum]|uniref:uncharacterized protein n=1 Tax=Penicillium brevicompactum TaxID=5074 RepID=UPI002541FA03|nr:uncharacterized protein N7506_007459 [Penicillium brevicompactum]KAJ5333676.1 hypothetical protein N7506_007459 [Penicillium brevicompactum]
MANSASDGFPDDFEDTLMQMLEDDSENASNMGAALLSTNPSLKALMPPVDPASPNAAVNQQLATVAESVLQDATTQLPVNAVDPIGADPINSLPIVAHDPDCHIIEPPAASIENAPMATNPAVSPAGPQFNATNGTQLVNTPAGSPVNVPVAMNGTTAPVGQVNVPYGLQYINVPTGSPENAPAGMNYAAAPIGPQYTMPYGAQPMGTPDGSPQNVQMVMNYGAPPMGYHYILPYGAQPIGTIDGSPQNVPAVMNFAPTANGAQYFTPYGAQPMSAPGGSPQSLPMAINHGTAPMGYQANAPRNVQQMVTPTSSPQKTSAALTLPLTPASKKKTGTTVTKATGRSRANGTRVAASVVSNHEVLNNVHLPLAIATPQDYAKHVSPFSPVEPSGPESKKRSLRSTPTAAQSKKRVLELTNERSYMQKALRGATTIDPETGKTTLETSLESNATLRRVNTTQSNVNKKLKKDLASEREKFVELAKQYNEVLLNLRFAEQDNMELKAQLDKIQLDAIL